MRPTQNNVFVSGSSGSGKTYYFVDWIVHDLIPWGNSTIVTNFPLGVVPSSHFDPPKFDGETFVDRISKYTRQDCSERIVVLDDETQRRWEAGQGGPWELELSGEVFLILDEFAGFCRVGMDDRQKDKWIDWLAKARHRNVHNLMISQSSQKIPRNVFLEFGEKWQLSDTAAQMIPGLFCAEGDVYQLVSKLIRTEYAKTQCMVRLNEGGTWTGKDEMPVKRVTRSRKIFRLYDSFSSPEVGGESSNRSKEWEVLSWPSLIVWFADRNPRAVLVVFAYVLFFSLVGFVGWRLSGSKEVAGNGSKDGEQSVVENQAMVGGSFGEFAAVVRSDHSGWGLRKSFAGESLEFRNSIGGENIRRNENRIVPVVPDRDRKRRFDNSPVD